MRSAWLAYPEPLKSEYAGQSWRYLGSPLENCSYCEGPIPSLPILSVSWLPADMFTRLAALAGFAPSHTTRHAPSPARLCTGARRRGVPRLRCMAADGAATTKVTFKIQRRVQFGEVRRAPPLRSAVGANRHLAGL